jgi:sterol desaturase/sphingolipid hydroxylase (fatty acid hydroxylase superfamily)
MMMKKLMARALTFCVLPMGASSAFNVHARSSTLRPLKPLQLSTRTASPDQLLGHSSEEMKLTEDVISSLVSEEQSSKPPRDTGKQYKFSPFQQTMRALPLATTALYILNPEPLDRLVATLWDLIYLWDVAQNPLFEAEVASAGFFIWIASFSCLHLILGEEKTKANRLDGQMPHDPFEWTRFENWHLWFNPLASYLGSIWLWLQIHDKPPMPIEAPSFGMLIGEVLFGVWLYDLCFFPIHYAMHRHELGKMRKVHGYHHRSGKTTMNALETVQHSYIDGFLQVFVNIMVQQISPFGGPKHVFSRLLHNLTVTYLLSEAHSGYDLPWMSHNVFPEILGGSPRHQGHHENGRVYYQQYFKYLDDFFGFTEEANHDQSRNNKEIIQTTAEGGQEGSGVMRRRRPSIHF